MIDDPGDARFKMMWGGQWCPVTHMMDRDNRETTNPLHAAKAVLYTGEDSWVATAISSPGEIVKRSELPASSRQWEKVD